MPRKLQSRIQETNWCIFLNFCEILFYVFFNKYQVNTLTSLVTVLLNIILLQVCFVFFYQLNSHWLWSTKVCQTPYYLFCFLWVVSREYFFSHFITVIDQVNYSWRISSHTCRNIKDMQDESINSRLKFAAYLKSVFIYMYISLKRYPVISKVSKAALTISFQIPHRKFSSQNSRSVPEMEWSLFSGIHLHLSCPRTVSPPRGLSSAVSSVRIRHLNICINLVSK